MSNCRARRAIRAILIVALAAWGAPTGGAKAGAAEGPAPRKIVLLAGTVHQGAGGHPPGTHEYELTARLLKHAIEHAGLPNVKAEVHFDGWPRDERTLDDADTIVVISDGADRNEQDHPLLVGDRLQTLKRQMDRGCGLAAIHWSVFVPNQRGGKEFLEWIGGYFDYQSGPGANKWYSKIQTAQTRPHPGTPEHPISRGLVPFDLREEYYYQIRFRENDPRLKPILVTPIPNEPGEQVVAWAVERQPVGKNPAGRGFGFTGGHFFENWGVENFRRMVLNAILWTAHVEVPAGGVTSQADTLPEAPVAADDKPIAAVIVTGHQHGAHIWRDTTAALQEALARDRRMQVTVVTDPEFLATPDLFNYDVVLLNYCNWQRPGLSDGAKANFIKYLRDGGGLTVIHFSNGAFHSSLPETPASDWPEYRNICRRVWDHAAGKSGHDAFGRFQVHVFGEHPITRGMNSFETIDELYFNQQGDQPIEVLATARSTVTGKDEPMAFVYDYGKGRVFQTVLGHAAESIRAPGEAELIRRGTVWAAGRPQRAIAPGTTQEARRAPKLVPEGRFGGGFDPRSGAASAARKDIYEKRPLTVECWAKLDGRAGFNILVANSTKESAEHWELYSYAGSGELSLYLPGFAPAEIKSGVDVTDGRWHYLAAAFDETQASLYVDGKLVKQQAIARQRSGGPPAALFFGGYPPHNIGCDGLVDEVRISRGLREIKELPTAPFAVDADTIGLWHFDRIEADQVEDASTQKNAVLGGGKVEAATPLLARRVADPQLKLVPIDTSPDESFLSLRLDTAGRLFAGGREALFVYEPLPGGGYGPRQLLYRFPPDTWITDVEIRGDDLYVMTNAALYVLPQGRVKRQQLSVKRLLWGSPVDLHVTWHGLAWGPEGDLYFSSGDPLLNYGDFRQRPDHWGHWTIFGPNGAKTPYTGVGGFYRCRPDGSRLQVVAGGTRGAVGIAFDRRYNLFGNDNDHESIADRYSPARLLHVAPQAHFFWPRGWIAGMSPERSDLLDIVHTGLGREVPVGQSYYDDELLGEKYADSVLLARWGQRQVSAYRLQPRGASFGAEERPLLIGEETARPVGVTVGRGGRVFAALSYMAGNEWSPKYPSEIVMITRADDSAAYPFEPYEAPTAEPERLWKELGSASWSRRQQAHTEILRRGGELLQQANQRLQATRPGDPAFVHLVWLAAAGGAAAQPALARLLEHRDATVRAQAVRAAAEFQVLDARAFAKALGDASPVVQHAAVVALFDPRRPLVEESLVGAAGSNDPYLRQAASLLLARRGRLSQIEQWGNSSPEPTRLAGVLAAGFRLTVPPAVGDLPSELPLKYESGNAQFTLQYADGSADLKQLGRVGSFTTAERWKNVPKSQEDRRLHALLVERLNDGDDRIGQQAGYFLWLLDDEETNALVIKAARERVLRRLKDAPQLAVEQVWQVGPLADGAGGFATVHAPQQGPIDLTAAVGTEQRAWQTVQLKPTCELPPSAEPASGYLYFRAQSLNPQQAPLEIGGGQACQIWHNGRAIEGGAPFILPLEPGSNDVLLRLACGAEKSTVGLSLRVSEPVELVLPEKAAAGSLAERLKTAAAGDAVVPAEFLSVDWSTAAKQGDAGRGRRLFGSDGLGCAKCHAILAQQKGGGAPSLAAARQRFTVAHLVESILVPSKQVAPVFGTTTVVTADGRTLAGLAVEETDQRLVLLLPTAARQEITKSEIEARRLSSVSPMPHGLVKTPAELADLLAYLLTADPQAP